MRLNMLLHISPKVNKCSLQISNILKVFLVYKPTEVQRFYLLILHHEQINISQLIARPGIVKF